MRARPAPPTFPAVDELHPARLLEHCGTSHLARRIVLFDAVSSTNAAAMAASPEAAAGEALFVAADQLRGRGRKGRSWFTGRGTGLAFSLLLVPGRRSEGLTAVLALAAVESLDPLVKGLAIKWPNDIFLRGRKLGGILAEAKDEAVALGLGLNVNERRADFPAALAPEATSLRIAARRSLDRGLVLCRILVEFEKRYDRFREEGFAPFREEIEARLLFMGEAVSVESGGETAAGRMIGITADGYLRLESGGTERVFPSGDLTVRRKRGR
jgi:BirA family biotin operon repressor/biotin-[acetyl-CoA-carboxylase] ligase